MPEFTTRVREALDSGTVIVASAAERETEETFAESVVAGLSDDPKWLHCRFLYDAEGSRLFEQITEQPEYYPTRTEAAILERHARDVQAITGPVTLVELGSGYSVKTEHLLRAYSADDLTYVPLDVSVSALRAASESVAKNFPDVNFTGIHGPYASAFPVLANLSPQMVVFLGSTLGNLNEAEFDAFWSEISDNLPSGDFFLLGVDLVKDIATLEAAYDDPAGITARFTKNYFTRMNRELGSDLDLDVIEHVAAWNPDREAIEIRAHFHEAQTIRVESMDRDFEVAAGESILMEISRKFRLERLQTELQRFGLQTRRAFTDEREWFGMLLLERE